MIVSSRAGDRVYKRVNEVECFMLVLEDLDFVLLFLVLKVQKQPLELFSKNRCSWRFRKIQRKTPAILLKKRLWYRCFPVNFTKFLKNTSGRLPLQRFSFKKIFWKCAEHPCRKCDFNIVAKQLYWNQTSAWLFSCKFAVYFENIFS